MATLAQPDIGRTTGTRISSYLLVEYLERLGVDVIFGLCGHTNIALLDALSKSRIRFITSRHEQVSAHSADGYARASGKPGVVLTHLGPGIDERRHRRRERRARFHSDGRHRRRHPMLLLRSPSASGIQPPSGRGPVRRSTGRSASASTASIAQPICRAIMERAFHLAPTGRPGPVLVDVPMDFFSADLPVDAFHQVPAEIARPAVDADDGRTHRADARRSPQPGDLCRRRRALGASEPELAALAEALEIPVAHSLMGKGCLPETIRCCSG